MVTPTLMMSTMISQRRFGPVTARSQCRLVSTRRQYASVPMGFTKSAYLAPAYRLGIVLGLSNFQQRICKDLVDIKVTLAQ